MIPVSKELCEKCSFSTTKIATFETKILRCKVCGCIIWLKGQVHGTCPKFNTIQEWKEGQNGTETS